MGKICRFVTAICLVACVSQTAYSWNRRGHLMVAAVAYRDLQENSPVTLQRVNEVLKTHPAASRWRGEYTSGTADVKNQISLEAYFFMRAAAWPDDVRVPLHNSETRPSWHFVNYPLRLPDSIDFSKVVPPEGIFFGMNKVTEPAGEISNPKKAKNLSWVFHLVGDVHQPLHTVALFNTDFTRGDSGGNGLCIRPRASVSSSNLHSHWDGLMGTTNLPIYDALQAWMDAAYFSKIEKSIKPSQYRAAPDLPAWAKESAQLALSKAYQFNQVPIKGYKKIKIIKNGRETSACPKIQDADILTDQYNDAAKGQAVRQILIAGYRLSNGLQSSFLQ